MNEIDEIRSQMAQIRHDLHHDVSSVVSGVSDVVNEVSEVIDWKSVLRSHPYILVGTALLAGYLIVPRRKTSMNAGQGPIASSVVPEPVSSKKRFRPISLLVELVWPIATQAAQAYALIWIEKRLKEYLQVAPDSDGQGLQFGDEFQRPPTGYRR